MQNRKSHNLGATSLRLRRRNGSPMQVYDTLPGPLRHWLAQASMPWSPTGAKRIWSRERGKGLSVEAALQALTQAETRTLARDRGGRGISDQ